MGSSHSSPLAPVGALRADAASIVLGGAALSQAIARVREPVHLVEVTPGRIGLAAAGEIVPASQRGAPGTFALLASLPALYPEWLGDRSFGEAHRVRFPYVVGEMANGIATTRMVIAAARAGMLGFFGAAGLGFERVERAVDELERELGAALPWGVNLIHSPNEPALEERVADLLIRRGVPIVSASAFMALTPAVVRCALAGVRADASGRVHRPRRIFAKISRAEVARRFMGPAPAEMLAALVARGLLTPEEAALGARIPVAEDVTVEADSGGHTDNQSLSALFPTILALRDDLAEKHGFTSPIRVGAAGGLGAPGAVAAAFALGAAYVVTGSVNQSAIESGLSPQGKAMLAQAEVADVIMAPAADMFELGVKVQVLKRGTMFGVRAARLYEAYHAHPSLDAIPADERRRLEREVLHESFERIWEDTKQFWQRRDPSEIAACERDPKRKMALVFRWYLGKASKWAIDGEPDRRADYQVWCGPAMGSFNAWAKGSFLADPEKRAVVQIGLNLLEGAAVITRAHQLRSYGLPVPSQAFDFRPRVLA
ncbi:MAG: PfaD family polyunsaturated fatty acid/polyketide biosynthesis protein [Byssovorax sp.]